MIGRAPAVLAIAVVCGALAAGQQARDTVRTPGGTASISGSVFVAGETKRPARRVRITLTNVARSSTGQTTTTDDNGAFIFRGLPAGRFELQAFKNAYLRASYGAARPDRDGTPVVVKEGEAVTDLSMTIARGGVITGVVRDARGRPLPGLNVRVLRLGYNAVTGERTLGTPSMGSTAVTDDRGEYRAWGLPPGGYLVLVVPPVSSGRGNEPIRQPNSPVRVDYAPVFHPGATDIRAAATVTLGLSEERPGVDVAIQLVPTATITGTITSSSGALPQMLVLGLVPAGSHTEMLAGAGLRGPSAQLQPGGSYVFKGVAPGTYTIKAIIGRGRGAAPNQPTQWAAADVNVSGQDLDVPLTLQPGVAINGRVVFEGAQPPTAAELQTLSFSLVPPGSGGVPLWGGGGRVDAEGRFTFAGVTPDSYQFTSMWGAAAAANRWTIKSSTTNGREAFEAPIRVNPNETLEWTITYTDKPTGLTGVLQDSGGRAATDYYMLVFSSDRRHWTPGSRRIRMTRPGTDGSYTVKGLPPGDYFLAAPTDLENGEWNDPVLLEQLARSAAKITLRDGELTTQDFRVASTERR